MGDKARLMLVVMAISKEKPTAAIFLYLPANRRALLYRNHRHFQDDISLVGTSTVCNNATATSWEGLFLFLSINLLSQKRIASPMIRATLDCLMDLEHSYRRTFNTIPIRRTRFVCSNLKCSYLRRGCLVTEIVWGD